MKNLLKENLRNLSRCSYPGRGLILGVDETGENAVQVYWIMGRGENSRNWVFGLEGDRLFTEAQDPAKVEDPSLIIYNAMGRARYSFVVSNGNQTDTVLESISEIGGMPLSIALHTTRYEPDKPNFTPRITGCSSIVDGKCYMELALLRKSNFAREGDDCIRFYYVYESIREGIGLCLTTYTGDGNPLPSFVGEPILVPLQGSDEDILNTYWGALNAENRVSLAVKFIDLKTTVSKTLIRNRFVKVG